MQPCPFVPNYCLTLNRVVTALDVDVALPGSNTLWVTKCHLSFQKVLAFKFYDVSSPVAATHLCASSELPVADREEELTLFCD